MSSFDNTIEFTGGTLDASRQRKNEEELSALTSREYLASFYLRVAGLRDVNDKASLLSQVGRGYYALYQETNQEIDLEKAISVHQEAVRLTSVFHPKFADHFEHAGDALEAQFKQNGDPAIIEQAILHYEQALSATDDNDPTKASRLCDLGTGLHLRFEHFGDLADINMAIINYQKAVEITPDGHPEKPGILSYLGKSLFRLFERLGSSTDLDSAIEVHQKAVETTPDSHPGKPYRLNNLAVFFTNRFEQLGSLTDLDSAIAVHQKALEITPDGHPDKPTRLSNVGTSLFRRFQRLGNLTDLDRAIEVHQRALETTPDGHPDKPTQLSNIGYSLFSRFERLDSLPDLNSAIVVHQKALEITPYGHINKPGLFSNVGNSLTSRFQRLSNLTDLDDAIAAHQKALETTLDDDPEKPGRLSNAGNSLFRRFQRLGNLTDIDSAIEVHQRALEITPDGHPDKPTRLSNVGNSLFTRFERLGSLTDLNSAIVVQQKALEIIPDGSPDKATILSNLGNCLDSRFQRFGSLTDLDSVVEVYQKALEITPDGHPDKPARLSSVGNSLSSRFRRFGNLTDLNSAIEVHQKAVEISPDGHLNNPNLLCNLGTSLLYRFHRLGNLTDVNSAIEIEQKTVEMTTDGHPTKPTLLFNLATSFICRFERLCDLNDLESALQNYSRAAHSLVGSAMVRFKAARWWAKALNQHFRSPLPAFQCAIDLLPRIAWLGLMASDQHTLLADIGDVVRDAVAAAVRLEEYETAVEWAEQGRSIVWNNLLNLRSPIDDLRAVNPALANRLENISQQLDSPVPRGTESHEASIENIALRYSKLGTEWDILVEEIRKIPSFEGFLKAKSFAKLALAACEGPVVILNVHQSRSDALVLIQDGSSNFDVSVVNIPLEPFTYELSKSLFARMNGLLASAGVRSRSNSQHEPMQHGMLGNTTSYEMFEKLFEALKDDLSSTRLRSLNRQSEQVLSLEDGRFNFSEILGFLWLGVVKPVLDGLGFSAESDDLSRVWWCATGPLSFLPIHAAGIYGTGEKGHIISDYVVSSYIPTLTSILEQSRPIVQANFQILTVAVAQSSIPNALPIYGTEDEVRLVQTVAKAEGIHCVNLTKESATVNHVLEEMMESDWIHLACHGQQNIADSMESGFLLHDGLLELSEIVKLSLPKADFAFLSACQTAKGDEKVAEESVHLAAGMLLSGCRGVVATMWSINDNDAPKVAGAVYRIILKDGRPDRKGAAYALHQATKRLRESGADFVSWVPFIHIGR